jgi:NAD(P)-dependent dehydrogenase (short-subunit alcohol dehydrogenase family)
MTASDGDSGDQGQRLRRFEGRRVIVTGASRGIGAGIAERLAAEGAHVAITARTLDQPEEDRLGKLAGTLNETAARLEPYGGKVACIVADLTDDASRAGIVPEAVAALGGPVEILVNNAAVGFFLPNAEFPLKRRRLVFEANVHAPLDLAQAVIPAMREAGEGWIVNLSSAAARPWPGPPFELGPNGATIALYGASKAALDRMTNGLAAELHGTGIRANTIQPRKAVRTENADTMTGNTLRPDQIESLEEMVEATVALCDGPAYVTGQVLVSLDLITDWGLKVHDLDGSPR